MPLTVETDGIVNLECLLIRFVVVVLLADVAVAIVAAKDGADEKVPTKRDGCSAFRDDDDDDDQVGVRRLPPPSKIFNDASGLSARLL